MFAGLKHSTIFQILTSGNNCTQHNHNLFCNNDIMLQKSDVQLDLTISLSNVKLPSYLEFCRIFNFPLGFAYSVVSM